jgi:hypothetical protein
MTKDRDTSTAAEDDRELETLVRKLGEDRFKQAISRRKKASSPKKAKTAKYPTVGRPRKTSPQLLQEMFFDMMCSDPSFEIGIKPYSLASKASLRNNLKGDISSNIRTLGDNFKELTEDWSAAKSAILNINSIRHELLRQRRRLDNSNTIEGAAILAHIEASEQSLDEAIYKFNMLRKSIFERVRIVSIEQHGERA